MTGLSILVDKYQMHEVVELYVRTWMPEVKKSLPVKKDPTLLPWISISYVFRLSAEYQHVTRLAVLESCGPLGNDLKQLLPIPGHVFDRIERHRQNGIKSLLGALKTIVDRYNKNEGVCRSSYDGDENIMRQGCDSMMAGSLLRSTIAHGLCPLPLAPYQGRSITQTAQVLQNLKMMALCDKPFFYCLRYSATVGPTHGMMKFLHDEASRLEKQYQGLAFDGTT
ncbi:hypothetical protein BKA65DRAFT_535878 [Rhexocercosporidium sp. MPI-PUGE-AT-0058]|nr:hypothetical protein BKA65DRAFT_535878 [Rhexocercosporidium sp. MPI-PUGE-AT-0058]